ncbi:hypothetical protein CDAR_193691 [Caerostris darwini]|uniref:Uncharacterized protein n=1 Tax=Caerostris darwini TaxID=1538125 RepID=A0AAV4UE68_9ARAC|nr:hypothetical protein CDAR_193691 [Caerostris darwini]
MIKPTGKSLCESRSALKLANIRFYRLGNGPRSFTSPDIGNLEQSEIQKAIISNPNYYLSGSENTILLSTSELLYFRPPSAQTRVRVCNS